MREKILFKYHSYNTDKKEKRNYAFLSWGQIIFREHMGFLQPFSFFLLLHRTAANSWKDRPPATLASWKKGWRFLAFHRSQARFCTYSDIYLKQINGFVLTGLMLRKKTTCQQAGHLIQTCMSGGQTHWHQLWILHDFASVSIPGMCIPDPSKLQHSFLYCLILCRHCRKVYEFFG